MNSTTKYPAFACSYSPSVPQILNKLRSTIAISTYQAGKLVFISAKDDAKLVQLPRNFKKAMGIAYAPGRMAVACLDDVVLFANSPELARFYPKKPNTYDALFVPRATYHTGMLDLHDLEFGHDGIYGVNTYFSCLIRIDERFNFTPVWKPPFISRLASEDRCHLNGLAMKGGRPKYATAFNTGDSPRSWKENITETGVLMDVDSGEFIARGLAMPHSPRLHNGKLYLLLSATGELVECDPADGRITVIAKLDGFVRGLGLYGGLAFVGLSRIRQKEGVAFSKLPIAKKAKAAGVAIVDLNSGKLAGSIVYHESVEELYDVRILPGLVRPNILNTLTDDHKAAIMIPGTTYWGKKRDEEK